MSPATPACLRDPARFASLYRDHVGAVRRGVMGVVADHALAEDVTQDVFAHVWRYPERWNPARGEIGAYLRVLARSRAIDALRAAGAAQRATRRAAVAHAQRPTPDAAGTIVHRSTLRAAVAELPDAQREAVALAFWGELTTSEIARRCALPHGTVKSRMRLGLNKLRTRMADEDDRHLARAARAHPVVSR